MVEWFTFGDTDLSTQTVSQPLHAPRRDDPVPTMTAPSQPCHVGTTTRLATVAYTQDVVVLNEWERYP
jgi:hypothetical protein